MSEPRYVDNPFDDFDEENPRMPKWRVPSTPFQRRILAACKRKYWPPKHQHGKETRGKFIMIEKALVPISMGDTPYPLEWVESCIDWFERKNRAGYVPIRGLLTLLDDEDAKNEFVAQWKEAKQEEKPDYGNDPFARREVPEDTEAAE